jgi:Domain of unknown function (DUF4226)
VTFGLPSISDIVGSVLEPAVENTVKVVTAVERVFSDDDHRPAGTPLQRTNTALYGPGGPPAAPAPAPAPPPDSAGGLNDGATNAGDQYNKIVDGAALTDDKLAALLKHIFESNQQARDKVNAILTDIQAKSKQIAPEMGDPASVMAFQKYMDGKFGEIQKLLSDSQVDAKTQAAIMDALGDEYKTNGPKTPEGLKDSGAGGGGSGDGSSGGDGGGGGDAAPPPADAGSGGGDVGAAGADPLTDPLAGMGPMGMGAMGGMDPMSSLAGLGSSLPGLLGGLGGGGGSPLDSLGGALGGLGSALPGLASQFGDKAGQDQGDDKFSDTKGDAKGDKPGDSQFTDDGKSGDADKADPGKADPGKTDAKSATDPAPAEPVSNAAAAAAPAAAPAVDPKTVSLPDGTTVTAPDDHRAAAMKAVVNGSSVSAAYGDQIPPAGSPVMNPVDRNSLRPGDYAQFEAKPAVMFMGNGKIWLDGQLKPVSALPSSSDFLGWTQPPATGGGTPAVPPSPAGTPATPPPPTGNHTA